MPVAASRDVHRYVDLSKPQIKVSKLINYNINKLIQVIKFLTDGLHQILKVKKPDRLIIFDNFVIFPFWPLFSKISSISWAESIRIVLRWVIHLAWNWIYHLQSGFF